MLVAAAEPWGWAAAGGDGTLTGKVPAGGHGQDATRGAGVSARGGEGAVWAELAASTGSRESLAGFLNPGSLPQQPRGSGEGGEAPPHPPGPAAGEQWGLQPAGPRRSRPAGATKNFCVFLCQYTLAVCGAGAAA